MGRGGQGKLRHACSQASGGVGAVRPAIAGVPSAPSSHNYRDHPAGSGPAAGQQLSERRTGATLLRGVKLPPLSTAPTVPASGRAMASRVRRKPCRVGSGKRRQFGQGPLRSGIQRHFAAGDGVCAAAGARRGRQNPNQFQQRQGDPASPPESRAGPARLGGRSAVQPVEGVRRYPAGVVSPCSTRSHWVDKRQRLCASLRAGAAPARAARLGLCDGLAFRWNQR